MCASNLLLVIFVPYENDSPFRKRPLSGVYYYILGKGHGTLGWRGLLFLIFFFFFPFYFHSLSVVAVKELCVCCLVSATLTLFVVFLFTS